MTTLQQSAAPDHLSRSVTLALSLRLIIAVAVFGMAAGAMLMFWEGSLAIGEAALHTWASHEASASVITDVMEATDKFLFGLVLVIFTLAITFGFLVELAPPMRAQLPRWIAVTNVGELKHVFFEVIVMYLSVDFVTDIAAKDGHRDWNDLVVPAAIFLLAGAMRLLSGPHTAPHD